MKRPELVRPAILANSIIDIGAMSGDGGEMGSVKKKENARILVGLCERRQCQSTPKVLCNC